ncbi:MAG: hypothetical protein ACOY4W_17610, partial [Thermodesulfobacteriota bacterium]
EEGDTAEAIEGRLLDRIGMLETATRTIDELFRVFLAIRTSPAAWQDELARLRAWIRKGQ